MNQPLSVVARLTSRASEPNFISNFTVQQPQLFLQVTDLIVQAETGFSLVENQNSALFVVIRSVKLRPKEICPSVGKLVVNCREDGCGLRHESTVHPFTRSGTFFSDQIVRRRSDLC